MDQLQPVHAVADNLHHSRAIYFDGHLPLAKRRVRMERLLRSTAQIAHLHSSNPRGCPARQLAQGPEPEKAEVFATGAVASRSFADPAFLVPAVIEALRSCTQYRERVLMVPGEADTFCARHVLSSGGLVLTSDSDLLVHELGDAEVVFFRDIQRRAGSAILCGSYGPKRICEKLGQPSSDGLVRLAYEQKRSPHASMAQILRACSSALLHENEYAQFCSEYRGSEIRQLSLPTAAGPLENGSLDPRLAELAIQLHLASGIAGDAHMFLPVLTENPARGSAWEHSTVVRQLAYSLLIGPDPALAVLEFRRIQSTSQKGRRVEIDNADLQQYLGQLLCLLQEVSVISTIDESRFWLLVCLGLDVVECRRRDKESLAWAAFRQVAKSPAANNSSIPWDVVHAVAQLQAMCYSFRLLRQALSVCSARGRDKTLADVRQLQPYLDHLPPLTDFPDINSFNQIRKLPGHGSLVMSLEQCLGLPALRQDITGRDISATNNGLGKPADGRTLRTRSDRTAGQNKFDILSLEE